MKVITIRIDKDTILKEIEELDGIKFKVHDNMSK